MASNTSGEPQAELNAPPASSGSQGFAPGGWQGPEALFLDRAGERASIDDLLDQVRRGFSGVLVLSGGHGVGKSTLVDYALGAASGFRIAAIAGVESEISLNYAALHQLLVPFLPLIDDLPGPQRRALEVAFGLETGPPPDRFLVGLACLTLVSRAAADQPVLCAVDDAHWIDAESALVLGFVARRLYADRVAMILTVYEADEPRAFQGLRTIDVDGLPADAAAELLRSLTSAPLEPTVMDRIISQTAGNPLALRGVTSQFTAEELAAYAWMPAPIPAGQQLQERYLRRVRRLPADVQDYLLLVAADGTGDRSLVRDAATAAGIDADAAESSARAAELVEATGNRVRFQHPLIRAAVYHGTSDAGRRSAHDLLSQASGRHGDAEGQVWHRAAAAAGPDEPLAADLEAAAGRARDRGALFATASLLRRSVALTPSDGMRPRRQVALAKAELLTGHPEAAMAVTGDALPQLTDSGTRGEAKVVIGESLFAEGRDTEAAEALADAAAELTADPAASADALLAALEAAMWAGPAEASKIATIPPPAAPGAPARVSDLLLAGYRARFTNGYDAAADPLRAALAALRADDLEPATGLRWFELGAIAAGSLWDDQALIDITDRWVQDCRKLGAVTQLSVALAFLAITYWIIGRLDEAADSWAEMAELMAASQNHSMVGIDSRADGLLLTCRGEFARARVAGLAQIRESTARGQGALVNVGRTIVAIADLHSGQFEAAVDAASPVIREDPVFTAEETLPELIEAAVRSDHPDVARSAFAILADRTGAAGTPWALGTRARCKALLAQGSDAEEAYVEAISQLSQSRAAVGLARAHLQYGQWLRRAKRRRDARRELRTAEDLFNTMGAVGFADQASSELRASGERARKRSPHTELDLTPQETRVATLAAEGSTNTEIAGQLFISPSTVDYHLGKVFRKLGVTSRTQLAHQLPRRA